MTERQGWPWIPDTSWRVPSRYTRCRRSTRDPCPNPPVADLARHHSRYRDPVSIGGLVRWWAYCGEHLFGRRIVDGQVLVQVHPDSPAAQRGWTT